MTSLVTASETFKLVSGEKGGLALSIDQAKARPMECVKAKHYLDELPVTIEIASYNAGFLLPVYC